MNRRKRKSKLPYFAPLDCYFSMYFSASTAFERVFVICPVTILGDNFLMEMCLTANAVSTASWYSQISTSLL